MLFSARKFFKLFTKNQKTQTTSGFLGMSSSAYYCLPMFCTPGTTKINAAGMSLTMVTSCCSTNYCNTGTATTDTNTLWCNLGSSKMGPQYSGTQSCPTTCMVRRKRILFYFWQEFFLLNFFFKPTFFKTATETVSGSTSIVYLCTPAGFACLAGASFSQDNATVTITQCCSTNYCNSAANSSISFGLFIATLALFVLSH
jgi:hypothetical protein